MAVGYTNTTVPVTTSTTWGKQKGASASATLNTVKQLRVADGHTPGLHNTWSTATPTLKVLKSSPQLTDAWKIPNSTSGWWKISSSKSITAAQARAWTKTLAPTWQQLNGNQCSTNWGDDRRGGQGVLSLFWLDNSLVWIYQSNCLFFSLILIVHFLPSLTIFSHCLSAFKFSLFSLFPSFTNELKLFNKSQNI